MAGMQATDINRRGFGNHIALHVDRKRAIVRALHIDSRNAAEPFRRQMNLRHERGKRLWP